MIAKQQKGERSDMLPLGRHENYVESEWKHACYVAAQKLGAYYRVLSFYAQKSWIQVRIEFDLSARIPYGGVMADYRTVRLSDGAKHGGYCKYRDVEKLLVPGWDLLRSEKSWLDEQEPWRFAMPAIRTAEGLALLELELLTVTPLSFR